MFSKIFNPTPSERASVVDLLRHPWTVGLGDPAEFDQLISQMDETMVHDETVAQKLEAMALADADRRLPVGAARVGIDVDVQLELDDGIDLTLDDGLYDELA